MLAPLSTFQKAVQFVRSVLPEQPELVVLLLGSALLLPVFRLGAWHEWGIALLRTQGYRTYLAFALLSSFSLAVVYAGGAAGLHLCLFPKTNPLEWLKRFVYMPVVLGWAINIGVRYYFGYRYPDLQAEYERMLWVESLQRDSFFASVGLSFWATLVAVACIWLASWSIRSGEMRLPVSFFGARGGTTDFQSRRFAWLLVVWTMPVTTLVLGAASACANPALLAGSHVALAELFTQLVITVSFVALLLLALKADAPGLLRATLKVPPIQTIALGVVFPLIVISIPVLVKFAIARLQWARAGYGQLEPPVLVNFFGRFEWAFLLMIISALAEEIAWRGYLQRCLISRYGLYRGIFFVGVVWGAFHFASDFGANTHLIHFVSGVPGRLVNCVAWGFVLSWLTLRSGGSVVPAGISHGLANALLVSGWMGGGSPWWLYPMWALLAFVLYRYWPPSAVPARPNEAGPDDELRDMPYVEAGTA
jgi:membrane protease YdiL (CAAX protease family)